MHNREKQDHERQEPTPDEVTAHLVFTRKEKLICKLILILSLVVSLNVMVIFLPFSQWSFAHEQDFVQGFSYEIRALISQSEKKLSKLLILKIFFRASGKNFFTGYTA